MVAQTTDKIEKTDKTRHILIDFENVSSKGTRLVVDDIKSQDIIYIFYTEKAYRLDLESLSYNPVINKDVDVLPPRILSIKCPTGEQSLDKCLTTYLGLIYNKEDTYVVVSDDKGYDSTIKFMCDVLKADNIERAKVDEVDDKSIATVETPITSVTSTSNQISQSLPQTTTQSQQLQLKSAAPSLKILKKKIQSILYSAYNERFSTDMRFDEVLTIQDYIKHNTEDKQYLLQVVYMFRRLFGNDIGLKAYREIKPVLLQVKRRKQELQEEQQSEQLIPSDNFDWNAPIVSNTDADTITTQYKGDKTSQTDSNTEVEVGFSARKAIDYRRIWLEAGLSAREAVTIFFQRVQDDYINKVNQKNKKWIIREAAALLKKGTTIANIYNSFIRPHMKKVWSKNESMDFSQKLSYLAQTAFNMGIPVR